MNSRSAKYLCNTIFMALLQVVTIISGFIVPRIMLKCYGSEINGLVTSITQFITYFNLVEAGLSSAATFALYKPLANQDIAKISGIVAASKRFYVQSGYVFTALTVLLSFIYPMYISTEQFSFGWISLLVVVLGSNGFLEFFTLSKYRVLLTADQKTYVVSIASLVQIIVQTVIVVLLSPTGLNVVLVRAIAIVAILLRSVILYMYCKYKYPQVDFDAVPDIKSLDKRWDALFLQILGAIHKGTSVVLLTVVVKDLALISVYSVFHIVVGGLNSILEIFNSGLSASFGEVLAKKQKETLQRAYKEFQFVFYSLSCVLFSVGFVMISSFVELYTQGINDANYNMPILAFMMLADGFLYHAKTPQGMLVLAAGMYKETKWRAFFQGMISLVGGILLAVPFGAYGIIFASILSNIYRIFDLWFFSNKHIVGVSPKCSFSLFSVVVFEMLIIVFPFKFFSISCGSWFDWLLKSCVVFAYSVVVVFATSAIIYPNMVKAVYKRVRYVVRKK